MSDRLSLLHGVLADVRQGWLRGGELRWAVLTVITLEMRCSSTSSPILVASTLLPQELVVH